MPTIECVTMEKEQNFACAPGCCTPVEARPSDNPYSVYATQCGPGDCNPMY